MSEIKKGTHGVLTNSNSGVTIPATVYTASEKGLHVHIDGVDIDTPMYNYFSFEHGWTFEPDITLPTEIGSVIQITRWFGNDTANNIKYRALRTKTGWHVAADRDAIYSKSDFEQHFEKDSNNSFEVVL